MFVERRLQSIVTERRAADSEPGVGMDPDIRELSAVEEQENAVGDCSSSGIASAGPRYDRDTEGACYAQDLAYLVLIAWAQDNKRIEGKDSGVATVARAVRRSLDSSGEALLERAACLISPRPAIHTLLAATRARRWSRPRRE